MLILRSLAAVLAFAARATAEEFPQLRAALLKTGTANWKVATISAGSYDRANGFELVMRDYADNAATRIAVEGSEADVMVADWIRAARMRAEGRDFVSIPYALSSISVMLCVEWLLLQPLERRVRRWRGA